MNINEAYTRCVRDDWNPYDIYPFSREGIGGLLSDKASDGVILQTVLIYFIGVIVCEINKGYIPSLEREKSIDAVVKVQEGDVLMDRNKIGQIFDKGAEDYKDNSFNRF